MGRLPRRLYVAAWIVSTALLIGGVLWFAFSPSTKALWLGATFMALPFILMLMERHERKGFDSEYPPDQFGDDGPWAGP